MTKYRILKNPFVDQHKYRVEKMSPIFSGPFWNRKFTGNYKYKLVMVYIGSSASPMDFDTLNEAKGWVRRKVREERANEYRFRPIKKK